MLEDADNFLDSKAFKGHTALSSAMPLRAGRSSSRGPKLPAGNEEGTMEVARGFA